MTIAPIQNTLSAPVIQAADIRADFSNQKENSEDTSVSVQQVLSSKDKLKKSQKLDFNNLSARLQTIFNTPDTALRFSIDKETNKIILKIVNSSTNELVLQIPSELALQLSKFIANTLDQQGQVTDATV